ncbi:MAG: hypothetical protein FWC73_12285 [Defluviitaleaceae bacterium]|nr:hypothetical protein [Defluviitaleaceae bacterium]
MTQKIKPINWGKLTVPYPSSDDANLVKSMFQQAIKYAVNKGYTDKYGVNTEGYIDFGNLNNRFIRHDIIRPPAMQALSIATALKLGLYNEEIAEKSKADALAICTKLVRSLAKCHKAAEPDIGWGIGWQDAWWAFAAGFAGWMTLEHYSPGDTEHIRQMVMMEADSFASINRRGLYYRDKSGKIRTPGDTKAEENAWDSNIRHLARAMMPTHIHRHIWEYDGLLLNISAYSAPMDLVSEKEVNGAKLRDWLEGTNAYDDGTVVNHDMIHPDYMASAVMNMLNGIVLTMGGLPTPEGIFHGIGRTYNALVNVDFDENYPLPEDVKDIGIHAPPVGMYGRNIYTYADAAKTIKSHKFYMPQGNDWGDVRQVTMGGFDGMISVFGCDATFTAESAAKNRHVIVAAEWEKVHITAAKAMQSRFDDGRMYADDELTNFPPKEEQACVELAMAVLAKWAVAQKDYRVTSEPPVLLSLLR